MAVAKMRHFNSPEELKRRASEGETKPKGKEFRHYNHPEEVQRRAAAGQALPERLLGVTPRRVVANPQLQWPPAGTVDNTASVDVVPAPVERAPTEPPPRRGDYDMRLRRIENLLWTFVDNVEEAREFRRLLNNQAAIVDVQLDINNRVRTIEQQIEAALVDAEQQGADDDGDDGELAPLADDDSPPPGEDDPPPGGFDGAELADGPDPAPPTVPDNPTSGGST